MRNLINPLKTLIRPKQRDEENSKVEKKTTKRTGEERNKGNEVKPLDSRSIKAPPSQGARVTLSSKDRVAFKTADKQLEKAVNLLSKDKQEEAMQALEKVSKALGSIAERNADKKQLVPRWFAACALPVLVKNDTLDDLKTALSALHSKEGNEVLQQLAKLVNQAIETSVKAAALYNVMQAQIVPRSHTDLRKMEELAGKLIAVAKSYPSTDAMIPGMNFTLKDLVDIKADAKASLALLEKSEHDDLALVLRETERASISPLPLKGLKSLKDQRHPGAGSARNHASEQRMTDALKTQDTSIDIP